MAGSGYETPLFHRELPPKSHVAALMQLPDCLGFGVVKKCWAPLLFATPGGLTALRNKSSSNALVSSPF
jgi:hypothetical protein